MKNLKLLKLFKKTKNQEKGIKTFSEGIETFSDGSRCFVKTTNGIKIMHLRLGANLNFISKIILTDGTIVQNMQYEKSAEIPMPNELLHKLKVIKLTKNQEKGEGAIEFLEVIILMLQKKGADYTIDQLKQIVHLHDVHGI